VNVLAKEAPSPIWEHGLRNLIGDGAPPFSAGPHPTHSPPPPRTSRLPGRRAAPPGRPSAFS